MKFQISNSGIRIEAKEPKTFGVGIGWFDSKEYGEQYLTVLLAHNERLSSVLRDMQGDPVVYFCEGMIYVVVDGDRYHYLMSLKDDSTGITEQIKKDKLLAFSIMSEDEKNIETGVVSVIAG